MRNAEKKKQAKKERRKRKKKKQKEKQQEQKKQEEILNLYSKLDEMSKKFAQYEELIGDFPKIKVSFD